MPYRDEDDSLEEEWVPAGDDEDDPDDWDDEGPGEEEEWIACPECRQQVYVESEQCPHCGHYITDESPPLGVWQGRSWWWIALGVLGIIAVIIAFSRPW